MNISNFWSRIGALIIDFIILAIVGFAIGYSFNNFVVQIGQNGLLIGYSIAILYFTIGNSLIMKGQTIGKKAVGITVVAKDGNYLTLLQSFLRSLILFTGYFLFNFEFPGIKSESIYGTLISLLLFSILAAVVFIYILNKASRQSLHDIIIGSFVINKEIISEEKPNDKPTAYSFIITGVLILAVWFIYLWGFNSNSEFQKLHNTYNELSNIDGVVKAGLSYNTNTMYGDQKVVTYSCVISLRVTELPTNQSEVEKSRIVQEALEILYGSEDDISNFNLIKVVLTRGFNLGIAKGNRSYSVSKSPQEWLELETN